MAFLILMLVALSNPGEAFAEWQCSGLQCTELCNDLHPCIRPDGVYYVCQTCCKRGEKDDCITQVLDGPFVSAPPPQPKPPSSLAQQVPESAPPSLPLELPKLEVPSILKLRSSDTPQTP
jgi:hypothetical protein